jgi:hypothetical protein
VPPLSAPDNLSNLSARWSSVSEIPAARIDDSPRPSAGLATAKLLDVEPDNGRLFALRQKVNFTPAISRIDAQ